MNGFYLVMEGCFSQRWLENYMSSDYNKIGYENSLYNSEHNLFSLFQTILTGAEWMVVSDLYFL